MGHAKNLFTELICVEGLPTRKLSKLLNLHLNCLNFSTRYFRYFGEKKLFIRDVCGLRWKLWNQTVHNPSHKLLQSIFHFFSRSCLPQQKKSKFFLFYYYYFLNTDVIKAFFKNPEFLSSLNLRETRNFTCTRYLITDWINSCWGCMLNVIG